MVCLLFMEYLLTLATRRKWRSSPGGDYGSICGMNQLRSSTFSSEAPRVAI